MRLFSKLSAAAATLLLAACASAPQQPIQLSQDAVGAGAGRIGVAMAPLPKVDTYFPGASCLLCIAAANAANSALTTHANTLPHEDLPKLKGEIADLLRKKGANVTVIVEPLDVSTLPDFGTPGPNVARKDYSSLQKKYNIDRVLVVNVATLGFLRTYSAYIPNADPKGVLQGAGYVVNLKTNAYEWFMPVNILKSAEQKWDEPPKYPGLTNAYFQALELGRDSFLKPFGN